MTLLGRPIIKSLRRNVARGSPKPVCANQVATKVPFISNAGIIGIPPISIPLLKS